MLTHFSNGRLKAPNSGINTFALNVGLNYNLTSKKQEFIVDSLPSKASYRERIKYNIAFRTGISEGPVPHLGQRQFYHFGFMQIKELEEKVQYKLEPIFSFQDI